MGASAQVLSVSAILTDVKQPPSVRLVAANLINALPGQMLLPHVPKLLPALRKASGDLDESVRNAASEAIRKLSPLRAQAVRAAQAAAAAVAAGQPPPPLGFGGGGAEELRLSLKAFEATAPMHDPKRPGRKLATHPVNLVQVCLHFSLFFFNGNYLRPRTKFASFWSIFVAFHRSKYCLYRCALVTSSLIAMLIF